MNVKEAASLAKEYVADLYEAEGVTNIGLEEIELDGTTWKITVGFSRPWDQKGGASIALGQTQLRRSFKLLYVDDNNAVVESVKDRILVDSWVS